MYDFAINNNNNNGRDSHGFRSRRFVIVRRNKELTERYVRPPLKYSILNDPFSSSNTI
jgi:hypothetical protein